MHENATTDSFPIHHRIHRDPTILHWFPSSEEILYPEEGGKNFLRNVGKYLPDYTASHPTTQYNHHCLRSSGLWHREVWYAVTGISEGCTGSAYTTKALLTTYQTTRCHNPDDNNVNSRCVTDEVGQGVTLHSCIREVISSNLGRNTDCRDWGPTWLSSVPACEQRSGVAH
jgi:hypothetical protein